MRILDYTIAADGGTQIIVLDDDDGKEIFIGIDGRMDSPNSGKQLFIGNSADSPHTVWLPIGSIKELEVIALLETWLDQTQGFLRREALIDADQSTLKGQELLDRPGLQFVLEFRNRDIG